MATYAYGRRLPLHPTDTKYIVHPHYATPAEASNEAIGHQVRLTNASFIFKLKIHENVACDHKTNSVPTYQFKLKDDWKFIKLRIYSLFISYRIILLHFLFLSHYDFLFVNIKFHDLITIWHP